MGWFRRKRKPDPKPHVEVDERDLPGNAWQVIEGFRFMDSATGTTLIWCTLKGRELRCGWKKRYELLDRVMQDFDLSEQQAQTAKLALDRHLKGLRRQVAWENRYL